MKIISFVGFADSGKNTASLVLIDAGYVPMSFASIFKDCLSSIFGWDRELLEGLTKESRIFRETVDTWWAEKLGISNLTPRFMMKHFSTGLMRTFFHKDIWVMSLQRQLMNLQHEKIVITDVRHRNEIAMIRSMNGLIYRTKRGDEPSWFEIARLANSGDAEAMRIIKDIYEIHESEMDWIGAEFDGTIENNGTINDLREKVTNLILRK